MFIKGTLDAPKCKFTRRLVESIKKYEYRNLVTLNILENERIRQWLKVYSKWPTFPQVFINGEFVGGIDIVTELIENDEFDEMVPQSCKKLAPKDALTELIDQHPVILFVPNAKFIEPESPMLEKFKDIGLQFSQVDLSVKSDFAALLATSGADFIQNLPADFKVVETCFLVMSKQFIAAGVDSLAEMCATEKFLEQVPAGCTKQTLE